MEKLTDLDYWLGLVGGIGAQLLQWLQSPQFYAQVLAIGGAIVIAHFTAKTIRTKIAWFHEELESRTTYLQKFRGICYSVRHLLFPALAYLLLGLAGDVSQSALGANWLILIARSVSVVFLVYKLIDQFVTHPLGRQLLMALAIPVSALHAFDFLDSTITYLDELAFEAGNIRLSAYFLIKTSIVGGFFFWLGSISNQSGQKVIRAQESLDIGTKELFSKLFQIVLFAGIFVLAMQVLGLDLTVLTVFGGALAVGVGFGLQQIASNFISGIILLLERSLSVGDFIELDDGRMGTLKALNMRSATLEAFDGKEVMVPNEKFITGVFINWTRDDPRQRYEITFQVAYDTDIPALPDLIIPAISKHPGVLQEPEKPDLEVRGFGDSGVELALEFWIEGIDDGKNRISSDLFVILWQLFREHGISVPYPQRIVHMAEGNSLMQVTRTTPAKPASKAKSS